MRIALETRALAARGGGVRCYVENLAQELKGHDKHVITQLGLSSELFVMPWLQWYVPRVLKKLQPEVVHFTKADVPRKKVVPTVVTIYDVIPLLFPEGQKALQRWYWPGALRRAAQFSDAILTISEASKQDIVEKLQVASEKVTVTRLGIYPLLSAPLLRGRDTPYILFVGTLEPRKNVPLLIRAFARIVKDIPHRLVIVGRKDSDYADVIAAMKASGVSGRVELQDFVSQEELNTLYASADLFAWPSIYEGWGLPPQEALAHGVPTVVSNGGSLPEVVGEAGIVVPFSVTDLHQRTQDTVFETAFAEVLRRVLTDASEQTRLREAGPKQAGRFTWQEVVDKTIEVYKKVAL